MTTNKLYVAQTVGVTEEQWFENGYDDSPLVLSEKQYHVHQTLFTAPDAEAAYQRISDEEDGDSDCNHDGKGHKTLFYSLGIHQIELLDWPLERLLEQVQKEYGGLDLASFTTGDVDEHGIPLIRRKEELAIFRHR